MTQFEGSRFQFIRILDANQDHLNVRINNALSDVADGIAELVSFESEVREGEHGAVWEARVLLSYVKHLASLDHMKANHSYGYLP